jgi:pimeloyl-ACP methyl ester carboxylesterase
MKKAEYMSIQIGNDIFDLVKSGKSEKKLIIIPGLSDGLIKPQVLKNIKNSLFKFYELYLKTHEVYTISRKRNLNNSETTKTMADDYIKLIKKLGINKMDLMGLSMGAAISQHIAADYPEYVNKLILVVSPGAESNQTTKKLVKEWIQYAQNNKMYKVAVDSTENTYTEKELKKKKITFPFLRLFSKTFTKERFIIQANAVYTHNASNKIEKIIADTLVVSGEKDKICPLKSSSEIAKKIKKCNLVIFENQGHALFEEEKEKFDELICKFLSGEKV